MNIITPLSTAIIVMLSFSVRADIQAVEKQLLNEIKQANHFYQQQTKKIAQERRTLLEQLANQEQKLKALSIEAKTMTRAKDEQSLTVEKLQERLQSWQQQHRYLEHLLAGIDAVNPITSTEQLSNRLSEQARTTQFEPIDIALKSGQKISGSMLTIGPVHVFISDDKAQGGLISEVDQQWQLAFEYNSAQLNELHTLLNNNQGLLALDTTNNRSVILSQNQESISAHLHKGGIWVIPILCFALLAFIIALIKAVSIMRLPALTMVSAQKMGLYQQQLFDVAQQCQQQQERDDLLFDQLMQIKRQIEKGLSAIAVTAAVAPLLGLLGTVSGMIQTFKLMTLFGAGDANAVSGGISESLVTTELGLIVAIPSLIAHAIMSRRCHHYMAGLESYAVKLSHRSTIPAEQAGSSYSQSDHEVSNVA